MMDIPDTPLWKQWTQSVSTSSDRPSHKPPTHLDILEIRDRCRQVVTKHAANKTEDLVLIIDFAWALGMTIDNQLLHQEDRETSPSMS